MARLQMYSGHLPGKAEPIVTKALTKTLAGDAAAAKEGQLGRLPGSTEARNHERRSLEAPRTQNPA